MKHDGPHEIQISINLLQLELLYWSTVYRTLRALALKELSHEMDLSFDNMYGYF